MCILSPLLRRLAVVAVLAFALVATGLAHRLPSPDGAALQAFVLAGGDLAGLCTDAEGTGATAKGDCPACRIAAAANLPAAAPLPHDADLILLATITAPRESRAVRPVLDPAHGLRAPPSA